MSTAQRPKILLVDTEPDTVEMLVDVLAREVNAQITCVSTAEDALDTDVIEPHDCVIAEVNLPLMGGLAMAQRMMELRPRPILLTSNDPNLGQAVAAIRAGAVDFFVKPFDIECLIASAVESLSRATEERRRAQRHHRLRELVRRVIRERRELNQRVDLICRDLVGAHRRLVHRFMDFERSRQ
jgi:DNA-binding NtrC family response regulator